MMRSGGIFFVFGKLESAIVLLMKDENNSYLH